MADELQLRFQHEFTPEIRIRLDAYVAAENERIAPGKVAIRSVVNEAMKQFLDKQDRLYAKTGRAA